MLAKSTRPTQVANATHSRWLRRLLSLGIVFHLWAILAEPLRFQTRGPMGSSPAANLFYLPVGSYAEFMYLTHGYAFFAPDPGPSRLIKVHSTIAGGQSQERLYPDLSLDRPRLLYHRHFMLSEFLTNLYRPASMVGTPEEQRALAQERLVYQRLRDSIRAHLSPDGDPASVELIRIEHRLPWLAEMESGMKLDDLRLYRELSEQSTSEVPLAVPDLLKKGWPSQ